MAVALIVSVCNAYGQQKADDATNRIMNQVVVTGTGTHRQAKDAVVPVQVITADDIRKNNLTSLEEVLVMLTPSVTTMTNGMGTTLSLNGLSEDYILILENGHRLTGDDRYTRINMANIKRIEVLTGACSALYGSEAIGGVVNIITDDTQRINEEHVDVANRTNLSTHGRLTESIAANVQKGCFQSSTSYQYKVADNWQVSREELVMDRLMPTGRVMSQAFGSSQFNQRFSWSFQNGLNLYVRGSYYNYLTERPQQATYYKGSTKKNTQTGLKDTIYTETPAYTYDLHREDWLYGVGANWKLSKAIYLEADFYSDNLNSERDSFDTVLPGGKQLTKHQHYYNGTLKGIFRLGSWNKLSAGAEYVHETYESYNFPFERMWTLSLFAQDELKFRDNLQAVLGLRYVQNQAFGAYATPSVSVMYNPGPVRLRAGYSTGYRTPTLLQMYYENDETKTITIGNRNLHPEKSNFYNLGAEYTNRWMTVSATLYYNQLRDMISYRTLTESEVTMLGLDTQYPSATKYQQRDNVNKATVRGFHLSAEFYLPIGLRLGGAYTYNHSEAKSVALNQQTQQYESTSTPIDRSVRNCGTAHLDWGRTWQQYRLNVRLQAHMQGRRWSTSYGYAPACSQFDLCTTHTWHLQLVDLEPGIGIQNIFNQRDTRPWNSNFSTLSPGRSPYVSFVVKFRK